MISLRCRLLGFILLICNTSGQVFGQLQDETERANPFYIDLNYSTTKVFEIQEGLLSIRYDDKIAKENSLLLTIYNWKREVVATYNLAKVFGPNYFNIKLEKDMTLEIGKSYVCEATNEANQHFKAYFRPIEPVNTTPPTVGVLVNPISVNCDDPDGNVVEFYGDIKGGRAPYTVSWYLLNDTRTAFIYQPRNEMIQRPGSTTIIRVDKRPAYYVMLLVKDACGVERKQMVLLTCSDEENKINTVFVEPIELQEPRQIN
ncbi:MAG TPA: hypothetical protein VK658_23240 [Chryseolinea sp.]|nr:hypothetical protein [Chryseolinea sp.]